MISPRYYTDGKGWLPRGRMRGQLYGEDETQQLMASAHLLSRDFAAAWQGYPDWRKTRDIGRGLV